MRLTKGEYTKRIKAADPLQLTLINYELLLSAMDDARQSAAKSPECAAALDKARECLTQLYTTLNMDVEFSHDLADLYLFVNRSIIHAALKRTNDEKNKLLDDAIGIITQLYKAWQSLAANENLSQINTTANPTFAGLTYDKNGNLTEYQDFDPNRGYKA